MDIPSIETFIIVAKKQSFSLAADTLYLTQPAVSKRIASLEAELSCKLFDRIKKKIILTEAGHRFLPSAERILNELKASKNELSTLRDLVSGELLMATSHHIGLHHLPPVLKHYVNQYPLVDLNLNFLDSEEACLAVENAEIDLAVITLPNRIPDNLEVFVIWNDPLFITLPDKHPLLKKLKPSSKAIEISTKQLLELKKFPAILPEEGTFTRDIINDCFKQINLTPQVKLSNNYLETIKMMVGVGLGWSVLPETLIDQSLIKLTNQQFMPCRSLGIVTHKSRTLSQAAQQMVNLIKNSSKIKITRKI